MSSSSAESPAPGPRVRRRPSLNGLAVQLCAVALSFVLVALLVITSSRSAFVAETHDTGNRLTAAEVHLTDDDAESAMFDDVTGVVPGTPVDRCIQVTYTGSVDPTAVVLYSAGAPTGGLAQYLDLTVEVGPATSDPFGSCASFSPSSTLYSGTLSDFGNTHAAYGSGVPTWDPAGSPETRTFRVSVTTQDVQAAQGQTASFGFSWEIRTS